MSSIIDNFWVLQSITIVATTIGMEGAAWAMHKYILHGPLWFIHASHHRPQSGPFEWNDLIGVAYALVSLVLCVYGGHSGSLWLGVGIGIALYGVFYFTLHDVLTHQRIRTRVRPTGYLARLVRAHKLHHKTLGRDGSRAFGFLYAAPALAKSAPASDLEPQAGLQAQASPSGITV
jgi:beta-carotene 3-hydroxylase